MLVLSIVFCDLWEFLLHITIYDLPKHYKGEMVVEEVPELGDRGELVKGKAHYHAFSVKPEWR